ncbi:acyltransferase domain-containing protein [Pendulispora brunnea]|uniref:Acyltransferase domain-containing protein n=1 Tax=Pendulispora brunnea TaxID=2905690 RepID=A0ABZ2K853_9BACT
MPEPNRQEVLARALAEIKQLRARTEAAEREKREPIAIVGMACRFPGGADSPEAFWRLLRDGVDATGPAPSDRWDAEALDVRRGGFLAEVDHFDAGLFHISAREAAAIDPQHRIFWELCWEALERAGRAPRGLSGSATGVFVGITNREYPPGGVHSKQADPMMIGGNAFSFIAGRLSYILGLCGPSVALDTACSSSLVAVHLACQSLRSRETDLALAGGVNLILSASGSLLLGKAGALSPDGRCKAFDASADGYARGEGAGVVVLSRLSDALARRDPILAVIRGSAVNQDGARSGLTVPNPASQATLIRAALSNAGARPSDVDYVEAHGTGTALGDPIEMRALGEVYAEGRSMDRPLSVGSVKTNIGHLESAAGMAGLIKTVLALRHRQIPPHLHFERPNPDIPWHQLPVQVHRALTAWERDAGARLAAVSSFGGSGTNVHLVLEEAPAEVPLADGEGVHLLTLSAKRDEALKALALRYEARLAEDTTLPLADLCFTANTGRSHAEHRLAITARSTSELRLALGAAGQGRTTPAAVSGVVRGESRPRIAFLFTGQGSQYAGMGRGLYRSQPAFRRAFDRCAQLFEPRLGFSLSNRLEDDSHATAFVQPALFALGYALAESWRALGVQPVAVLGHSVGEITAACVAGALALEDAVALVAERATRMQSLPAGGAMFALACGEDTVRAAMVGRNGVHIAALNGPTETVVSGEEDAVTAVAMALQAEGIKVRRLPVSHAFHSSRMDPILDDFERAVSKLRFQPPRLDLVSGVSGRIERGTIPGAAHWSAQLRQPVRFGDGMKALAELGIDTFIELGPAPTLSSLGRATLPDHTALWLPSLRPGKDEAETFLGSLARLYVTGTDVAWDALHPEPRRRLELPTYPFQRQRYWMGTVPASRVREGHPLLGTRSETVDAITFEGEVSASDLAVMRDFRVFGTTVVSGVVHVSLAILAAADVQGDGAQAQLSELTFFEPFILSGDAPVRMRLVLTKDDGGVAGFELLTGAGGSFRRHSAGRLRLSNEPLERELSPLEDIRARCPAELSAGAFYRTRWADTEQWFGPSFKGLRRLWWGEGELLAEIHPTETGLASHLAAGLAGRVFAEACAAEACAQAMKVLHEGVSDAYLGVGMDRSRGALTVAPGKRFGHARLRPRTPGDTFLVADVRILDESGRLVTSYEGLRYAPIKPEVLRRLTTARGLPTAPRPSRIDRVQLVHAPPAERRARLEAYLLQQIAILAGAPSGELDIDMTLDAWGFDSIQFTELRSEIRKDLALDVPVELLSGNASPRTLASELSTRLAPATVPAPMPRNGEWVGRRERLPAGEARLRLFCLPFAGGGASVYRGWGKGLPRGVEVCPIQLPGRESRFGEAFVERLDAVLDALEHELSPLLDLPFAFFGTSMGGVIAFELARRLRARHRLAPTRLIAASSYVPRRGPSPALAEMMHSVLTNGAEPALLRRFQIVPEALLANPDALAVLMPPLYADLHMMAGYRYVDEAPLDCPITVLRGSRDPLMTREDVAAWAEHTRGDFSLRTLEGEHLFVRTDRQAVLRIAGSELGGDLEALDEDTARAAS